MSDLIEQLPEMLRKVAKTESDEGEYDITEHIDWMAADRIEELEAMTDLIERLRMQSQQEDSVEEEAIAEIERQADRIAKLEAVINTLHAGLENKHTVEALGTRLQRRDNKIAKLERQVKRLQNVVKDWETTFEG